MDELERNEALVSAALASIEAHARRFTQLIATQLDKQEEYTEGEYLTLGPICRDCTRCVARILSCEARRAMHERQVGRRYKSWLQHTPHCLVTFVLAFCRRVCKPLRMYAHASSIRRSTQYNRTPPMRYVAYCLMEAGWMDRWRAREGELSENVTKARYCLALICSTVWDSRVQLPGLRTTLQNCYGVSLGIISVITPTRTLTPLQ